jgi:hypothetical protein
MDDMTTPGPNHPANRGIRNRGGGENRRHEFFDQNLTDAQNNVQNAHFGNTTNSAIAPNVVSMAAYKRAKDSRRPEGY